MYPIYVIGCSECEVFSTDYFVSLSIVCCSGKRANGHIASARGASGGESSELGGQSRLQPASPKYHINQQQQGVHDNGCRYSPV